LALPHHRRLRGNPDAQGRRLPLRLYGAGAGEDATAAIKPSDRSRIPLRSSLPHRHARPCAGHPRLNMDEGGKDVDGRDGPGHDDSIASASEAIQAVRWIALRTLRIAATPPHPICSHPLANRPLPARGARYNASRCWRAGRRQQAPQARRGGGVILLVTGH